MALDPSIILAAKPPEIATPMQTIGGLMQLRDMSSQVALRNAQAQTQEQQAADIAMQTQQRQRDLQSWNQLRDLMRDRSVQQKLGGGDFSPIWDAGVTPGVAAQAVKNLQGMQTTAQALQKGKAEFYAAGRSALAAGLEGLNPDDDAVAASQYNGLRQTLGTDHPELAQRLPVLTAGPNFRSQIHDLAASNGIAHAILENQAALDKTRAETAAQNATAVKNQAEGALATAQTPGAQAKSEIAVRQADAMKTLTPEALGQRADATIDPTKYPDENKRLKQQLQGALALGLGPDAIQAVFKASADRVGRLEAGIAQAKATVPVKIDLAAGEAAARAAAGGLTDDDLQRAGEQYARTGIMPALGRDSVTRSKITHYSNQWARDNGFSPADLVTMQAAYSGDKKSLEKFQAQRDQIVSFESTAQKNLQMFLDAASKIPDAGAPWLNTPIRSISLKGLGSADLAAVNAARQVANNEIAKVTSGGGLSGVLSDTARREIQDYNPANATFNQTLAVAKVLQQDMANRHESMDATIGDIKARLGGGGKTGGNVGGGAQQNPGDPASYVRRAVGPGGHEIGQKADGGWYDVKTGAKVQ